MSGRNFSMHAIRADRGANSTRCSFSRSLTCTLSDCDDNNIDQSLFFKYFSIATDSISTLPLHPIKSAFTVQLMASRVRHTGTHRIYHAHLNGQDINVMLTLSLSPGEKWRDFVIFIHTPHVLDPDEGREREDGRERHPDRTIRDPPR